MLLDTQTFYFRIQHLYSLVGSELTVHLLATQPTLILSPTSVVQASWDVLHAKFLTQTAEVVATTPRLLQMVSEDLALYVENIQHANSGTNDIATDANNAVDRRTEAKDAAAVRDETPVEG